VLVLGGTEGRPGGIVGEEYAGGSRDGTLSSIDEEGEAWSPAAIVD